MRESSIPGPAVGRIRILTLKFVCHYGEYLPQSFLGKETFVDYQPGARQTMVGGEYHCYHGHGETATFRIRRVNAMVHGRALGLADAASGPGRRGG